MNRRRVTIVGGGMAGMTVAWELSRPRWRDRIESVTVLQRDGVIGGKGASTRGPNARIQEHGLHVWLGYYDNAFELVREVYDELDRPRRDPGCPIRTVADAFEPVRSVGVVEDGEDGAWTAWLASFADHRGMPGGARPAPVPSLAQQMAHNLSLLASVLESLGPRPVRSHGIYVTASARPPVTRVEPVAATVWWLELAELASLIATVHILDQPWLTGGRSGPTRAVLTARLVAVRRELLDRLMARRDDRRFVVTVDLLLTAAIGALADGLLRPGSHRRVDGLDFRHWLGTHGATRATLESPILRGMYDLVFAYVEGDRRRPQFAAGLGLILATRFFFSYTGSLFWRMRAGMGEIVFAPMHQVLRARGVRIEYFREVTDLVTSGDDIAAMVVHTHGTLRDGFDSYDPLGRFDGLPCFPATTVRSQIEEHEARPVVLEAGRDYDVVVLAASLGDLSGPAARLAERSPRWRSMLAQVATVATHSVQLWTTGARPGSLPPGAVISGFGAPLDTVASMEHLLEREDHDITTDGLIYLCGARADDSLPSAAPERGVLDRLGIVADATVDRYESMNTDGSSRYVQSLPGSSDHRLRVDESGYRNLVLAGDWTACGLEAGCIEAAVLSGRQAANTVLGRPIDADVLGGWSVRPPRVPA